MMVLQTSPLPLGYHSVCLVIITEILLECQDELKSYWSNKPYCCNRKQSLASGTQEKESKGGTGSGPAAFTPDGTRLPGDTLLFFPSLGPADKDCFHINFRGVLGVQPLGEGVGGNPFSPARALIVICR